MKPTISVVSSYFYGEDDDTTSKKTEAMLGITAGRRTSEESREEKERQCRLDEDLGYMFTQEEYEKLKYESPLVKQLRTLEVSLNVTRFVVVSLLSRGGFTYRSPRHGPRA